MTLVGALGAIVLILAVMAVVYGTARLPIKGDAYHIAVAACVSAIVVAVLSLIMHSGLR